MEYISTLFVFPHWKRADTGITLHWILLLKMQCHLKKSLNIENDITCDHLPIKLAILDANVNIVYTVRQQVTLSVPNKHIFEQSSLTNTASNTAFSLSFQTAV